MSVMEKSFTLNKVGRLSGRVLLVDDSLSTRRLTGKLLGMTGLEVTTADNGRDAVDIAWLACNKSYGFDLILMDLDMPVMGGLQATRLLREIGFDRPIIALSASTDEGIEQRCLDAGFNRFVGKPYDFSQLCTVLRSYLPADSLCAA